MRTRLVILSCAVIGLVSASPATAHPFRTGIYDQSAFYSGDSTALRHTRAAGASLARIVVNWYEVSAAGEPTHPADPLDPVYDWSRIDRFVRQTRASGLDPVLAISGTPGWAKAVPGCQASVSCAPKPADLGLFAQAAAARYNGSSGGHPLVRYWQAWSEPNLDYFLVPRSPGVYRRMVNAFSAGIKRSRARDLVIAGGLAPLARPGATLGPLRFMRELLCMKGRARPRRACAQKTSFDIWSTHPYTTGGPNHSGPGQDSVSLGDLPEMTRLLRAADRYRQIQNSSKFTPFWVTEFSWDTKPPDPGGVPLRRHARWTAEALYRMYRAGVNTMFWFQIRDAARHGEPFEDTYESGLYFRGATIRRDRPKPALGAFRFPFVALPAGRARTMVWGRSPPGSPRVVRLQARYRRGGWRTVRRVRTGGAGVFDLRIRGQRPRVMRAIAGHKRSIPFAVRRTKDYYQPPFGGTG